MTSSVSRAMAQLEPFEKLLAERIGLNPASVGHDEIQRAVGTRMRAACINEPGTYLARLLEDPAELEELVELVLVPETWFFREPAAFELVGEHARRATARRPGIFRVLSAPCSTGDEAYSLAITLLDAGLTAETMTVDGMDVSRRALAAAARATFGPRAVRYVPPTVRLRYFDAAGEHVQLRAEVAGLVTFRHGNLVDPDLLPGQPPYDVVFCRNLLMYLDDRARDRVLTSIRRLLARDGLLVTGHAEGLGVVAPRFVSAGIRGVFAYRPSAGPLPPSNRPPELVPRLGGPSRPRPTSLPGVATAGPVGARDHRSANSPRASTIERPPPDSGPDLVSGGDRDRLDQVARLADRGRLAEARRQCVDLLARRPDLAEGHYVLGVIELAADRRDEAEAAFRRAIYLEPRHERALLQLALQRARRGDARQAERLRRRAALAARRPHPRKL